MRLLEVFADAVIISLNLSHIYGRRVINGTKSGREESKAEADPSAEIINGAE